MKDIPIEEIIEEMQGLGDPASELDKIAREDEPTAISLNLLFSNFLSRLHFNFRFSSLDKEFESWMHDIRCFGLRIMNYFLRMEYHDYEGLYYQRLFSVKEMPIKTPLIGIGSGRREDVFNPYEKLYMTFERIQYLPKFYETIQRYIQCRIFEYYIEIIQKITLPPLLKQNLILEFEKFLSLEKTFKEYII
jgi:hypothetical protein